MDRHERLRGRRRGFEQAVVAQPTRPPQYLGELEAVDQQDPDDGELGRYQEQEHGPVERAQIKGHRHADRPHHDRGRKLDQAEEEQDAADVEAHEMAGEPEHRQQGEQGRADRLDRPGRILGDLAGQRELRLARRIEHAPVGFGAAADVFLPGLVDRFHHVVVDVLAFGHVEPFAQELRLVLDRGLRVFLAVAIRGPADFGDHDRLAREQFPEPVVLAEGEVDRVLARNLFPVRQQVHADEVDVVGQFRVALPDEERLGGRDRDLKLGAGTVDVGDQLVDADVAAQDRLVADHSAGDVLVLARQRYQGLEFGLVVAHALVDPGPGHHFHVVERGQARNLRALDRGIRAQPLGVLREQADVAGQLGLARKQVLGRILVALERAEGHALDAAAPVRYLHRPVQEGPQAEIQGGDRDGEQNGAPERFFHHLGVRIDQGEPVVTGA